MKTSGTEQRPRYPHSYTHLIFFFTKAPKTYDEETAAFSTNVAGKTGYLHAEN
jgi:hypothetical protein